jgi:Fe-S cluster assembly ATP-binding protein
MTESTLQIDDLRVSVQGKEILRGVSLAVSSGSVQVVMGPNGSGKSTLSHVIMGRPGYEITGGSITIDGADVLAMEPWQRAEAGLFLAMQYPTEVPGVPLDEMLAVSARLADRSHDEIVASLATEAERIGFDESFLHRSLNVDLSGGEKKRNETLQLAVLRPRIAVLDELDSGLDIDALRAVSSRIEDATNEDGLGVLAITHYNRLLRVLRADRVHILVKGEIRATGGPELADTLEEDGYAAFGAEDDETVAEVGILRPEATGPYGDPFADPLA